jgi:hypothetical protein
MTCNHNDNCAYLCAPQTKHTCVPPPETADSPCLSSKDSLLVASPESLLASLLEAVCTTFILAITSPSHAGTGRRFIATHGPLVGVSATPRSAAIATSSGTRHRPRDAVWENALVTVKQDKMDHDDADNFGAQSLIALAAQTLPDGTGNANQTKRKRGGLQQGGLQRGGLQQGGWQQGGLEGVDVYKSHMIQKLLTNQPGLTLAEHLRLLMSPAFKGKNACNNVHKSARNVLPKHARKRLRGRANGMKTFNDHFVGVWNNELSPSQRDPYNKWAKEITRRLTR